MKDVVYCPQGQHIVAREKMTALLTAQGNRKVCVDCKNKTIELRRKIKEREK